MSGFPLPMMAASAPPPPPPPPPSPVGCAFIRSDTGLSCITIDGGANFLPASSRGLGSTTKQIAYGNDLWGAAEGNVVDLVYRSVNLDNWESASVGEIGYGLSFGNGVFVWSGDNAGGGNLKTTTDLVTFTDRTAVSNIDWLRSAFDPTSGNFVVICVTAGGTGTFQYSADDGATWAATNAVANGTWNDVAGGNGAFVVVGGTTLLRSLDGGVNFGAPAGAPAANNWRAVAYGEVAGQQIFVAVASSGTNRITRSLDNGDNWSASTTPPSQSTWVDIEFLDDGVGGGTFIIIGTNLCAISTDGGDNWTAKTLPITGTFDNICAGSIPSLTESASVFDIATAEYVSSGYDLAEVTGNQLGTSGTGIIIDSANKFIYVGGGVSSTWRMNKFSYVSLENFGIGVSYVSNVNMTSIFAAQTTPMQRMCVDETAMFFYFIAGGTDLVACTLSAPYDFATAVEIDRISIATLNSQTGVNWTSWQGSLDVRNGEIFFGARIGNTGTSYRLCKAALDIGGGVSGINSVTQLINFTSASAFTNFAVNPTTGDIYVVPVNGTFDIREYVSNVYTGSLSLSGIPGLGTNEIGDGLRFDAAGEYLLLGDAENSGNGIRFITFKSP